MKEIGTESKVFRSGNNKHQILMRSTIPHHILTLHVICIYTTLRKNINIGNRKRERKSEMNERAHIIINVENFELQKS